MHRYYTAPIIHWYTGERFFALSCFLPNSIHRELSIGFAEKTTVSDTHTHTRVNNEQLLLFFSSHKRVLSRTKHTVIIIDGSVMRNRGKNLIVDKCSSRHRDTCTRPDRQTFTSKSRLRYWPLRRSLHSSTLMSFCVVDSRARGGVSE